jgi:hypothetical protein
MGCAFPAPKMAFRSNQGGHLWKSTFTGRTSPCSRNVSRNAHRRGAGSALEVRDVRYLVAMSGKADVADIAFL